MKRDTLTFEVWNDDRTAKLYETEAEHRVYAVAEHLRDVGYSSAKPQAESDCVEVASVDDPAAGTYHVEAKQDGAEHHGGTVEARITEQV